MFATTFAESRVLPVAYIIGEKRRVSKDKIVGDFQIGLIGNVHAKSPFCESGILPRSGLHALPTEFPAAFLMATSLGERL